MSKNNVGGIDELFINHLKELIWRCDQGAAAKDDTVDKLRREATNLRERARIYKAELDRAYPGWDKIEDPVGRPILINPSAIIY